MIPGIEHTVEQIKKFGLSLCADYDEDCQKVYDHQSCWMHEEDTGTCPFLCAVRIPLLWGERHLGRQAFDAMHNSSSTTAEKS